MSMSHDSHIMFIRSEAIDAGKATERHPKTSQRMLQPKLCEEIIADGKSTMLRPALRSNMQRAAMAVVALW